MKLYILTVSIVLLISISASQDGDVTVPVNERVRFLKFQLQEQLKRKVRHHRYRHKDRDNHYRDNEEPRIINANYDYVDISQVPITPINENDDRKRNDRFKLRQLKTTTTTTKKTAATWPTTTRTGGVPTKPQVQVTQSVIVPPPFNPFSDLALEVQQQRLKESKEKGGKNKPKEHLRQHANSAYASTLSTPGFKTVKDTMSNAVDVFYRRLIGVELRNKPIQWTHCEDMITPYLTGIKKELSKPKLLTATHRTVLRLAHLLSLNTTNYSKDDIYSLMYQISNIHVRLFQWEIPALKVLFNAISKGKRHNFKTLKYAMRNLFKNWHMDISNTTNLLTQSRLFRPYCVNVLSMDGSTKSSKVFKYVTSTTPKNCDDADEEDRRRQGILLVKK